MYKNTNSEVVIYQAEGNVPKFAVKLTGETVWLSQKQMSQLFSVTVAAINQHLKSIFESGELDEKSVIKNFLITADDGKKYNTQHYNLDLIIAVGYRVNSKRATQFRIWATKILREYIVKGFSMDDARLKGNGGGDYWRELLDRIRDIRSSEKALYRQVLDLYATSTDYDPKSPETIKFFKVVQNKLHYATNLQTAAEVIYSRADSTKDFMGLTTFNGTVPVLNDVVIAKNYLTEKELFTLNRRVSAFFDLAEIKAQEHEPMYMKDWVLELDKFAKIYGKGLLLNSGKVSHDKAEKKAISEYRQYQVRTISPIELAYIENIRKLQKETDERTNNKLK